MTGLLASVTTAQEAQLAMAGGADLIDLKDPSRGALGALDPVLARDIVRAIAGRRMVSATVGDFPAMRPEDVLAAAWRTAELGVDFIKVGFFGTGQDEACMRGLAAVATHHRLVAVLFADLPVDLGLVEVARQVGLAGVMFDTARKAGPGLRGLKTESELREFLRLARAHGLIAGLAGKLRLADIAPLLELQPDYLGFRGALCKECLRMAALDPEALRAVRAAIPAGAPRFTRGPRPLQAQAMDDGEQARVSCSAGLPR
jgi:dihydroneopterin aldolase